MFAVLTVSLSLSEIVIAISSVSIFQLLRKKWKKSGDVDFKQILKLILKKDDN